MKKTEGIKNITDDVGGVLTPVLPEIFFQPRAIELRFQTLTIRNKRVV